MDEIIAAMAVLVPDSPANPSNAIRLALRLAAIAVRRKMARRPRAPATTEAPATSPEATPTTPERAA